MNANRRSCVTGCRRQWPERFLDGTPSIYSLCGDDKSTSDNLAFRSRRSLTYVNSDVLSEISICIQNAALPFFQCANEFS